MIRVLYSALLTLLLPIGSTSFGVELPRTTTPSMISSSSSSSSSSSPTSLGCICIDCKWVTSCKAYHFVESKHDQPHMTDHPTFEPRDGSPTIHVNIRTIRTEEDRQAEIQRMWREHAAETQKAMKVNEDNHNSNYNDNGQQESPQQQDHLVGEQVYNLAGATTYEYDVVACDDYVEDKGCWIRNMPEEIRKANPNFVPS